MRTVIYPGSFDPPTNGHFDVIQRASRLFDRVIVGVARNENKKPLFSLAERRSLIEQSVADLGNVEVDAFEGLLVKYVEKQKGNAVIRGLRAVSDFEFEFQMALMNRKLNEKVETLFMMPRASYSFLSSTLVKEIAGLGGAGLPTACQACMYSRAPITTKPLLIPDTTILKNESRLDTL